MTDGTATGASGDARQSRSVASMVFAVLRSGALGLSGLLAIAVWTTILLGVFGDVGPNLRLGLSAVALGLGTGSVALLFLLGRGMGLSYLDFRVPDWRGLGYAVGGVVALFVLQVAVAVALTQVGVQTADHSIEQTAQQGNPQMLLVLIPASWLLIGPGEELLYRNIIQKSLYDTFSKRGALVVASAIFALAHIPAYAIGSTLAATAGTLVIIFLLSLVLGFLYLRTGNLTVSALVHGTFDAIIFAAMYVSMV
ncbi:lysostaphin resistance A-like protein [Halomicrococcus sp. SG-WS-1]|uniref:CPBP family intramembrane glutamic endopeptidase n=1 Tax=Halomicrococcus sp. SG-WS-1 TaxID=3439057 RepID=UPI003F79C935